MSQATTETGQGATDLFSSSPATHRLTNWLYAIFFLSGISGLMYEVVWVRMLTRLLGSTVYATATVLSGFMAGLALGSFVIGRFIDRTRRPLLIYALLEFGIAVSALLSLLMPQHLIPLYQRIYEMAGGSRGWQTAGQVLTSLIVLLVPTSLMGATLPTLCAFGARQLGGMGRSAGMFYALNTLGGVVGVFSSGFVFLGELGERNTVFIGVVLNVIAGAATLLLRRMATYQSGIVGDWSNTSALPAEVSPSDAPVARDAPVYSAGVGRAVVACFAVSGFAALASEVVWSRLLTMYQGTSIYAFSAMLGVLLAGMGVGSYWVGRSIDRWRDPLRALVRLELAIGLAAALALHVFDHMGTPARPNLANRYQAKPFYMLIAPAVLIGPLGLLGGAIFPVAARCYARSAQRFGRNISELYAWNTVGCIIGPLVAGFWLIPAIGTSHSAVIVAAVSLVLGIALMWKHPSGMSSASNLFEWLCVGASAVLLATVGDPYYRHLEHRMGSSPEHPIVPFRHVEDASGTTTAFSPSGIDPMDKRLWVNGMGMTDLVMETKLMAHLPISLAEDPKDVLVICFGMGTTVRSVSRHEQLNIWAVEMMPAVLQCFGYFHQDGPELLNRPNTHAVSDDGRNFLLVRSQQYDVITVDPAPPLYSAGTVNLYSREFFELCRSRLNPGGVMCLWVPPANYSEVKMILKTFVDVFEHTSVWSGVNFQGLYLLGRRVPFQDVAQRLGKLYEKPEIVADITEWGPECEDLEKLLKLHIADGPDLQSFLADTPMITDDRPYTEFPLWRALFGGEQYSRTMDGSVLRSALQASPNRTAEHAASQFSEQETK